MPASSLKISGPCQALWRFCGACAHRTGSGARRIPHAARAVGLGQDHAAQPDRRAGDARRRPAVDQRPRRDLRRAVRARHRHGVPELRAVPAHDRRRRTSRFRSRCARSTRPTRSGASTEALELVRLPHVAQRYPKELSGGQQQRIALARCLVYKPVDRADGRAARRARQEAARPDAARDQAHPPRARHHDRLRHARPGRGDDDVGSHLPDERRQRSSSSARRRSSTSARARCSSPTSSANPTCSKARWNASKVPKLKFDSPGTAAVRARDRAWAARCRQQGARDGAPAEHHGAI